MAVRHFSLQLFFFPVLIFSAITAAAQAPVKAEFCQRAQQVIARTSVTAEVVVQTDFEAFVDSKATTGPLTVQQFLSNPMPGADGMATVLSCKLKTAERINAAQTETGEAVAQGNGSCQAVHQYWLDQLRASIPAQQQALSSGAIVADEEESTYMGPMWLRPWPFEPISRDEDGVLHLRSKALYVPFAWWIPLPDKFKGTYYCHLVSPLYLEAILRGDVEPGV